MKRKYAKPEFELVIFHFNDLLLTNDSDPEGNIIRDDPNDPGFQDDPFAGMP